MIGYGTKAIEIECPACKVGKGERCKRSRTDYQVCQARIDAAAKLTRDANQVKRRAESHLT